MKNLITQDPAILGGKPIITGTRMSVEAILELLASNMEIEEILREYPFLKRRHVLAAIDFASKLVGKTETYTFDPLKITSQPTVHEVSRRR